MLLYLQLANVTHLPGESPSTYIRRFRTQVSLIKQSFMQPVTSPPAQVWGLDPIINPGVTGRYEWDAGPFKCFIKSLEVVLVNNNGSKNQVATQHQNPFQVGDMVVKVASQPPSSDSTDEPYLVAEVILGGYCKLINTDKLDGIVIHSRWLKPFKV